MLERQVRRVGRRVVPVARSSREPGCGLKGHPCAWTGADVGGARIPTSAGLPSRKMAELQRVAPRGDRKCNGYGCEHVFVLSRYASKLTSPLTGSREGRR